MMVETLCTTRIQTDIKFLRSRWRNWWVQRAAGEEPDEHGLRNEGVLDGAEMGHRVGMVNAWEVAMVRAKGQMENLEKQVCRAQ